LEHDPTNLNYWHIQLNALDYKNTIIPAKQNGAWTKPIVEQIVKNILCMNAYKDCPNITKIPTEFYKRWQ
jgi:hypothetical protein